MAEKKTGASEGEPGPRFSEVSGVHKDSEGPRGCTDILEMGYTGRSCVGERNGKLTDMGDKKESECQDKHRVLSAGA